MSEIVQGDCLFELSLLPSDSIDSCVTDPPYGLSKEPVIGDVLSKWLAGEDYTHTGGGFMGKTWDSFVPGPSIWKEVYRVLKPGAYALVFAGTRTQDLMTIALRIAGFEVRDVIEWLYFSGFPKSMDVGKAFDKRDGAEREKVPNPLAGKQTAAVGTAAYGDYNATSHLTPIPITELARQWDGWGTALKPAHEPIIVVRKPLIGTVADNVERYGTGGINIDGCRIAGDGYSQREWVRKYGGLKDGEINERVSGHNAQLVMRNGFDINKAPKAPDGRFPANAITADDDTFYSPYFNVSPADVSKKASKKDRGEGNTHPTVKPTDLMAWLVRLVTPPGGTVLDPFAGSGTTLVAAKREGFEFIGIERETEYVEIADSRVSFCL